MPWSGWLVSAFLVLMALPVIGAPIAAAVAVLLAPTMALVVAPIASAGSRNAAVAIAALLVAALATAIVVVLRRLMRPNISYSEERFYSNALILLVGVPVVFAAALWRLRGLHG